MAKILTEKELANGEKRRIAAEDLLLDLGITDAHVAEEKRLALENTYKHNPWGFSARGLEAHKAATAMVTTKTGMYARIPLICKGDTCPYAERCAALSYDLAPVGELCPIETSQIEALWSGYASQIDYENASMTDRAYMNEIITLDILMERCKALMAKEGTPVVDVVMGMTDRGDQYSQPIVSKSLEAYQKLAKQRNSAYNAMMMTRYSRRKEKEEDRSIPKIFEVIDNVITVEDMDQVVQDAEYKEVKNGRGRA